MFFEANDIEVCFGETLAVKGISFSMQKGDTLIIIGHNGSGKSSTVKALAGVTNISKGSIRLNDVDISKLNARERLRESIVFLPQGDDVFRTLTIEDNLLLFVDELKHLGQSVNVDEVYSIFPEFEDKRKKFAGNLSGGEQRLLSIARALVAKPKLLILDEPSSGLSPLMCDKVYDKITTILSKGYSLILVEQLIDYAIDKIEKVYSKVFTKSNSVGKVIVLNQGIVVMEFNVNTYNQNRDKLASIFLT